MSTQKKSDLVLTLKQDVFRSGFVSAIYALFTAKKARAEKRGEKYLLQTLADDLGVNKSQVSRWFSSELPPNWRLNTAHDICESMNADIQITIIDRETHERFGPYGRIESSTPAFTLGDEKASQEITRSRSRQLGDRPIPTLTAA